MNSFKEICKALLDEIPYESPTTCLAREALLNDDSSSRPTAKELQTLWQVCNSPGVFARAVLERWGNLKAEPVPVSEKPWERPGWCDERGRCWAWSPARKCWHLMDPRVAVDWIQLLPFDAIPSLGPGDETGGEQ